MSILKLLEKKLKRTLFTTPTHNQKSPHLHWLRGLYEHDYSELEGFDNLQAPTGVILEAQKNAAEIYKTKSTFFLLNGSTSGILAIMKALLNCNDRVLVARNCHKAVYSGLVLSGASVDWILPETENEWGIYGKINPKTLEDNLKLNNYKAFILTSPTYEGINSDIKEISKICKQYGVYLIVDEAHGALYNFSKFLPKTAIGQGADFSVNSLHKNAGAPNPCALLHISKNCDFEPLKMQEALNLITTTSPSYPLLVALEATINFLHKKGECEIKKLIKNIENFKKPLQKKGYEFLQSDPTKILMRKENTDMTTLSAILLNGFNIEDEMVIPQSIFFLCGIGTNNRKLNKLKDALMFIQTPIQAVAEADFQPYPFVKLQPAEAFHYDCAEIDKSDAVLKLSAQTIAQTPPCCAIINKGEVIQQWHLNYLPDKVKVLKHEQ